MRTTPGDHDRDLEERVTVRRHVGDDLKPLTRDRQPRVREDLAAQHLVHPNLQEVKIGQVLVNHCLSPRPVSREAGNTFQTTGIRGVRR